MRAFESKVVACVMAGVLALCQAVPAGVSFADEGEPSASAPLSVSAGVSSALAPTALAADDTFAAEVEGVKLVFQVIDAEARTVRLGTGEGRGNGLAGGVYPADHKVVVPEAVCYDGVEYAIKEIAASALCTQGVSSEDSLANHVGDVTIRADLDWVGEDAFSGGDPFAWRLEGNGTMRRIAVTAFRYCGMDELTLPEGVDIDTRDGQDNLWGPTISNVVYPLNYTGTVYCGLSKLKSLYVKSAYSRIDAGDENHVSVSVSAQAKAYNDGKKIPYYAWPSTQAANAIMNSDRVNSYVTFRAMAVFSDWTCPEWAVPEGSAAYTCKANVELGIEDGAVYPFAPTPSAKCVDEDGPWTLTLGADYTVEYYDAAGEPLTFAPTQPGTYGARFIGNDKGAWGSTDVISYTIGADLSDASVDYDEGATAFAYSGAPQSPAVTVEHGGSKLTSGLQYMERYIDAAGNTSATAPTLPGSYVKRIASRTPWAGLDVRIPFEIRAVRIASAEAPAVALSGGSAAPRVVVRDEDGAEVAEGAYKATITRDGAAVTGSLTQPGAYAVQVEGDGKGCTGSASCELDVVAADRALASAEQAGALTFTGGPLAPAFKVLDAGGAEVPASAYTVALADADGNAVDELVGAGEYTATVSATGGEYAGSATCAVSVGARELAAGDVQVTVNRGSYDYIKSLDWAKLDGYDEGVQPRTKARVYLSEPVAPAAGDFDVAVGGTRLVAGRDFDVALDERVRSDEDDRDHETTFTVTLKGDYSGTVGSADLPGAPKVTVNKRVAHTVWHRGVKFSYAVDTDGRAVVTGLGIDLSTSTQASELAAAYQPAVWGQKVTVPGAIADGDSTYQVKAVCPNAFDVPRDGGNGSIASIAVLNGATELEVEAGVESVEASAFPCGSIEKLTLHEGLDRIEPYAFSGASVKCKEIVIPASVRTIGYAAFGQNMNTSALEKFEFAEGSRFCGWSQKGIELATDDISGGVVRLTGDVRKGTNIVDGGCGVATTRTDRSCAPATSLSIPAQFTSLEYVYWDFVNCQDVYVMADHFSGSAPSNGIANNLGDDATVWGWDVEGTPIIDVVDANSSLKRFRPFAVLGDGYEYEYATGGPRTYPGNVAVGEPSVSTVAGEQAVDWDFQLGFANRKYRWTPVEGEDFTVTYTDVHGNPCDRLGEAGVYTATLIGNGVTCFGTATAEVEVGTELPADAEVVFAGGTPAGFTYDGTAHEPVVESVTLPGAYAPLDPESEYSVRYEGSVGAGTLRVVIEGRDVYFGSIVREFPIAKAASSISLAAQTKTYTGKALAYSGKVTKSGSTGAVSYRYYGDAACTRAAAPKAAGTYYVKATVAADANHAAATSAAAKLTVAKAENPLAVKAASKTLKAKALKKKAQSFAPPVVKKKGQGKLTYAKGKVSKKSGSFTVNKKTGKITVKKGTPKGTYTVQVKVKAAGNANYKASAAKVAKVKVKVK